jgi:OOP family OmpA-OmpF porin
MRKLVLALLAGAAAWTSAQAQTTQTMQLPRGYIGLGGATVDHDYRISGFTSVDRGGWDTSFKVFGGYEVDPIWGAEVGYTDFSKSDFHYVQNGAPGSGNSDGYGVYIAGKGRYPLNDQFEAYGKLGIAYSHRSVSTTTAVKFDDHDTGIYAGVGVQWNVYPQWSLLAEYERYGKSKDIGAKADVFSFGARYSF